MTNKQLMSLTAGLLIIGLGLATLSAKRNISSPVVQSDSGKAHSDLASFNEKVQLAKGGDEAAVANLTKAVFEHFAPPLAAEELSRSSERFVRAEMKYRNGKTPGIPEARLVETLNRMAKALEAPDYARVSVSQVRFLRLKLMTAFPGFIGPPPQSGFDGHAVNPKMSPLEATALGLILITQKLSNEEFQVTPEEWETAQVQKQLKKLRTHEQNDASPSGPKLALYVESAKTKELKEVFLNHISDALPLLDNSLQELGIPR